MKISIYPNDLIKIGCIFGSYGIYGHVKICTYLYEVKNSILLNVKKIFIKKNNFYKCAINYEIKIYKNYLISYISCSKNIESALKLRGYYVYVSRCCFPLIGINEYYLIDFIGYKIFNVSNNIFIGLVKKFINHGNQITLCVSSGFCKNKLKNRLKDSEILIPFVSNYIDNIIFSEKKIFVFWEVGY